MKFLDDIHKVRKNLNEKLEDLRCCIAEKPVSPEKEKKENQHNTVDIPCH